METGKKFRIGDLFHAYRTFCHSIDQLIHLLNTLAVNRPNVRFGYSFFMKLLQRTTKHDVLKELTCTRATLE